MKILEKEILVECKKVEKTNKKQSPVVYEKREKQAWTGNKMRPAGDQYKTGAQIAVFGGFI